MHSKMNNDFDKDWEVLPGVEHNAPETKPKKTFGNRGNVNIDIGNSEPITSESPERAKDGDANRDENLLNDVDKHHSTDKSDKSDAQNVDASNMDSSTKQTLAKSTVVERQNENGDESNTEDTPKTTGNVCIDESG